MTANPPTANPALSLDDLVDELDLARRYTAELVDGLTPEQIVWRPHDNSSAIGWHLGHQAAVCHYMVRNLTAAEPPIDRHFDVLFDSATPEPVRSPLPPVSAIVEYRDAVAASASATLARITQRRVGAPRPTHRGGHRPRVLVDQPRVPTQRLDRRGPRHDDRHATAGTGIEPPHVDRRVLDDPAGLKPTRFERNLDDSACRRHNPVTPVRASSRHTDSLLRRQRSAGRALGGPVLASNDAGSSTRRWRRCCSPATGQRRSTRHTPPPTSTIHSTSRTSGATWRRSVGPPVDDRSATSRRTLVVRAT